MDPRLFLTLVLAYGAAAAPAAGADGPKDVVAGEVGMIACGETIAGQLSAGEDEELADGVLADRYHANLPLDRTVWIRAASTDFDADVSAVNRLGDLVDGNSDAGDGTDALLVFRTFPLPRSGPHDITVSNEVPGQTGGYTLSVTCREPHAPQPLPAGPEESWNYHYLWDGFYVEAEEFLQPVGTGRGLAIEVQRGQLFGALYAYDAAGEPIFLTLQSDSTDPSGRQFEGTVYETREDGTETSAVGTFRIGLDGAVYAFLNVSIVTPDLELEGRWKRFAFGAPDDASMWDETRILFVVATTDPEEQAFVAGIGTTLDLADGSAPFFFVPPFALFARSNDNLDFAGRLVLDPGSGRIWGALHSRDDFGDMLELDLIGNHRGFVGTAVITIDDRPGEPRDFVGLVVRTEK